MQTTKKFLTKLRTLQDSITPMDKLERNLFFQDVEYDNFTRLIFIALAYFIFESWVLISSFDKSGNGRLTVVLLMVIYASAMVVGVGYRRGKLKMNATISQIVLNVYCGTIVARGLYISIQNFTRGNSITPLILALTVTSAFFYCRVLATLVINLSVFGIFVYNLLQVEWPVRPVPVMDEESLNIRLLVPKLDVFPEQAMKLFNDMLLVTLIACFLAVIIVNLRLKIFREKLELEGLSRIDSMTKLLNHINIYEALAVEVERAAQVKQPLTVVMLDIDYFKKVNDNHGHTVGDKVLQCISDILKEHVRETDYVGRYGGEEFMLVLTNTDREKAEVLCERIRVVIEACTFAKGVSVTVSLGISQFDSAESATALVERADNALYRAKENGRNRIEVWV